MVCGFQSSKQIAPGLFCWVSASGQPGPGWASPCPTDFLQLVHQLWQLVKPVFGWFEFQSKASHWFFNFLSHNLT